MKLVSKINFRFNRGWESSCCRYLQDSFLDESDFRFPFFFQNLDFSKNLIVLKTDLSALDGGDMKTFRTLICFNRRKHGSFYSKNFESLNLKNRNILRHSKSEGQIWPKLDWEYSPQTWLRIVTFWSALWSALYRYKEYTCWSILGKNP